MKLLALGLLLFVCASTASAQSMSIHVRTDQGLTSVFDVVVGEPFDVVTLLNTGGHQLAAAEWWQTELLLTSPGIFKLMTVKICNICDDFGLGTDCRQGEYRLAMASCLPAASDYHLLLVQYLDFGGYVGLDTVLGVRGFGPGDCHPSTFDGSPGFVDCAEGYHQAEMDGDQAWITGSGVVVPPGGLVLNPTPPVAVENSASSIAILKGRFQ